MLFFLASAALAAPPDTATALAVAESFQEWALESPRAADVPAQLVHSDVPAGVTPEFADAVVHSLGPDGALGRVLRQSRPELALPGPDYTRVVFGSEPIVSLVIRDFEGEAKVDRIEQTSCRFCDEPSRAVRDLLARSAAGEAVLWPHQDLSVTSAREARELPAQRIAALQKRAVNRDLAPLLAEVEVLATEEQTVHVRIGERDEAWPLVYEHHRWMVDYGGLAKDSLLRLSRRDAEDFRPSWKRTVKLLAGYEPDPGRVRGGRRLTTRVVGAAFDPRDGTVLTAVFDVDRATSGLLRIDPNSGEVLDRWDMRAAPRIPIDLERWFDTWHLALSPDGYQVALSSPGQIDVIDLVSGKRQLVFAFDEASHLAWVDTDVGAVLVIGQRSAVHMVHRGSHHSARVDGPTVGAYGAGTGVGILTESGTLFHYELPTRDVTEERSVCCGAARGVAASENRSEVVVTCPQTCELAGERLPYHGAGMTPLEGAGTFGEGVAWSPDGTLLATAAMGEHEGFLLWNSRGEPIAAAGEGRVRSLSFDPWGERILAVTSDGEVHLFELDEVRRRGLADPTAPE
ncbi:MAG: hypothetical protein EP330_17335 [Deltaproteobacteria bacterium]|nr:MAG: hypothetical protein EP330_17335 [Deltaproteobacteria bacterium]